MKYTIMYHRVARTQYYVCGCYVIVYFFGGRNTVKKLQNLRRCIFSVFLFFSALLLFTAFSDISGVYADESFTLKQTEKTIYTGPGSGIKAFDGETRLYKHINVNKLIKGFDPKKYDIRLKSSDRKIAAVNSKKDRIYSRGAGSTEVLITIWSISDNEPVFEAKLKVNVLNSAEITETATDRLIFKCFLTDEDTSAEDFCIYEEINGIPVFFSYVSKIGFSDNGMTLELFRSLESSRKYILEYRNVAFEFISGACSIEDVELFEIVEKSINADEDCKITFRYFNAEGIDITKSVSEELDPLIELKISEQGDYFGAYLNGHSLHIIDSGKNIILEASLEIGKDEEGNVKKRLVAEGGILSLPKKGTTFSGNYVYTLKSGSESYLKWGEKCVHSVPFGDEAVLEVLFEMDDGTLKNFSEAGITDFLVGDMKIAMIGTRTAEGGVRLVLNSEGTTTVIAFRDEEIAGTFDIEVLPARKPAELKVELSKDHLNTDMLVDDYIIIRTDLYDQYGAPIEGSSFSITQSEFSKDQSGNVVFNEIGVGRFLVNGWECKSDTEQKVIIATASAEGFEEEFKFFIRDVQFDSGSGDYEYKLEADGSKLIDTALTMKSEAPKSTFVTAKISCDGYYVGEGIGYLFDEIPSVMNGAAFYGVSPGDCIYGITIEQLLENGEKKLIGDDEECIVPTYMDIEFIPYVYGEKLAAGTYDITVYRITAEKDKSNISISDTLTIRVIDSDPEVEVVQLAQTYVNETQTWDKAVKKYFSFKLGGEDISGYITKVDCVVAPSGSVYVRSVEFMIPDPYFGMFTKTALVERLITKQ